MNSSNYSLKEIQKLHEQRDIKGLAEFVNGLLDRIGRKSRIGPKKETIEEYHLAQLRKKSGPLPPREALIQRNGTDEKGEQLEDVTYPLFDDAKSEILPYFCGETQKNGRGEKAFWDLNLKRCVTMGVLETKVAEKCISILRYDPKMHESESLFLRAKCYDAFSQNCPEVDKDNPKIFRRVMRRANLKTKYKRAEHVYGLAIWPKEKDGNIEVFEEDEERFVKDNDLKDLGRFKRRVDAEDIWKKGDDGEWHPTQKIISPFAKEDVLEACREVLDNVKKYASVDTTWKIIKAAKWFKIVDFKVESSSPLEGDDNEKNKKGGNDKDMSKDSSTLDMEYYKQDLKKWERRRELDEGLCSDDEAVVAWNKLLERFDKEKLIVLQKRFLPTHFVPNKAMGLKELEKKYGSSHQTWANREKEVKDELKELLSRFPDTRKLLLGEIGKDFEKGKLEHLIVEKEPDQPSSES